MDKDTRQSAAEKKAAKAKLKREQKQKKIKPLKYIRDTFTSEEQDKIDRHFDDFKLHCHMARRETDLLREDIEKALIYYRGTGITLDEALRRLCNEKFGGFYASPSSLWFPLDDAAKIYPFSMREGYMSVFRLAMNMKEEVVPELLQMALNFTIKRFPVFATTLKKGFFWHYLDSTKRRFTVHEAKDIPCSPIPISQSGSQSFRVLYYKNRISVEFFHILTDGTGGVEFLRALVAEYLALLGYEAEGDETLIDISETPTAEDIANEFARVEKPSTSTGFMDKMATQMSGTHTSTLPCRIIHFKLNTDELRATAKRHGGTVTMYLLAQMFIAAKASTENMTGEINIQVPVNMRKFYPSKTTRNFAMYTGIRMPIEGISTVEKILPEISEQVAQKASHEAMSAMMAGTEKLVNGIKFIPVAVKAPVAKLIYGFLGEKIFTTTLSNLGQITMPRGYAEHIQDMEFTLGPSKTHKASCAVISYGSTTTFTITKNTLSPVFEEKMRSLLANDGLALRVEGSPIYEY